MENLYNHLKDKVDFHFFTPIDSVTEENDEFILHSEKGEFKGKRCILSTGRSGSRWMESVCSSLVIASKSDRVILG